MDERFRPFVIPAKHPARRQLEAGWALYLAIGEQQQVSGVDRIRQVVFSLLVRVWRLYRCALALAVDGFGPESESLSRAMYEANLTAFWALCNPEDAVAQFDLHIDYMFHLQHEAQPSNAVIEPMDEGRRTQATKLFGKYGERPWCGKKVRELDEDLRAAMAQDLNGQFDDYFNTIHRWLNWSVHGSPINLMRVVDHTAENRIFYVAPHEKDISDALTYSGSQLILSIALLSLLNQSNVSDEVAKGIYEVWRSSNPAAYTAERNDPCPCGGGKKFKHCHMFRGL